MQTYIHTYIHSHTHTQHTHTQTHIQVKATASMESKQRLKDCIDELYDPHGDHLTLLKIFNSFKMFAEYVFMITV
jgi:hypothetical protein